MTAAITKTSPRSKIKPRAAGTGLSSIGWTPERNLEFPEWVAAGRRLGSMVRASQWWIGDWIRYGTTKWGEKYVEAARITGYDQHSLRNMAYVAARFDLSLRSDKLTWSHHVLLAPLACEEQRTWIERAVTDRLSVEDLRIELRAAARRADRDQISDDASGSPASLGALTCPNCGQAVPVPIELRASLPEGGTP